jgi:hypothetical protein
MDTNNHPTKTLKINTNTSQNRGYPGASKTDPVWPRINKPNESHEITKIASNYRKIVFSGSIGFTSSNPPTIHRKIGSHGLQSLSRTLGVSMSLTAVCVSEWRRKEEDEGKKKREREKGKGSYNRKGKRRKTSSNPPTIHRKIGSHGLQSLSRTLGVSMSLTAVCVIEWRWKEEDKGK